MISILSGSPRKNSNTIRVAKALKRILHEISPDEEVRLVDFTAYDIPSASQGFVDPQNLSQWQKELYESCLNSKLIFILTPEYNWFPSAEIIQMIHVMASRNFKEMWNNKVLATCGVSNGRGGRMPAVQLSYTLNKIINAFNFESVVSAKMFESQFTDKVLDVEGNSLGNEEYMNGLMAYAQFNLRLSDRWHTK